MSKTSKQEEINELKKALERATFAADRYSERANRAVARADKLEADRRADKGYAELAEQGRETAAKLAREQEALDLLKLGYVKVETLRDIIRAEYNTESHPSVDITRFTLLLRSTDRVEDALRAAILVKPKPKFAAGGYVGNHADPSINASLDAVRRSVKNLAEGSHRVVWGNDL